MSLLVSLLLTFLVIVTLFASRRWAFMAMAVGVLYLGQGSGVTVFGFNMYVMRFLELAGFIRVVFRGEISFSRLTNIDRTFLLLYSYCTIVFLLRSNRDQVYQLGIFVDALLCYFAFRGLLETVEEFKWFLCAFVVVLLPYVTSVLVESLTNYNFLSVGGNMTIAFRNGRIRAVGSFRHPSLLGTLGGSFLPMYIGLWFTRNNRLVASVGIAISLIIVWSSNSGAPLSLVVVGLTGWILWRIRARMNIVRRCLSAAIVLLALVMKAPIWYLLDRISSLTGGDGYHRAHLLDMAFRDMGRWWLVGMSVDETDSWFPYHMSTGGVDIANTFVSIGLTAGLAALVILIVILTRTFRNLGRSLALFRSNRDPASRDNEFLYWGMGVVVAIHVFNWLGITYYDQTAALWCMQLAVISTLTGAIQHGESTVEKRVVRSPRRQTVMTHSH